MAYTDMEQRILDMWPKFEDGGYVRLGDAYIDTGGDDEEVEKIEFNGKHIYIAGLEGFYTRLNPGERVKRPAPKVLDADGVEIKVGDTVWHAYGSEWLVEELNRYGVRCFDGAKRRTFSPTFLTHNRPDSWKRLEEDARQLDIDLGDTTDDYPRMSCCRDLIRRAKALAEKEAGR